MDDQTVLAWGQPQASLMVRQGAGVGTSYSISGDEVILGREEGVGISIRDPEVSRRHARISWQSGNYFVEDVGSTNGTFLNGVQITGAQPLRSGDAISIGQTSLVFQTKAEATQAQPGPTPPPSPPPMAAPLEPEKKRSKCLLWGCGCLVLLGLLVVIAVVVAVLAMPGQLEDFLNSILSNVGLNVDVMLYGVRELV